MQLVYGRINKVQSDNNRLASKSGLKGKQSPIQLVNNQTKPSSQQIHLVKSGDTLEGIAKHYHVSVKKLQAWNKLDSDFLKPGEKLKIMLS